MKNKFSFLLAPLMLTLSSFAFGVDFNLQPLAQGGNSDMVDFAYSQTAKDPSKFVGKTILVPISTCVDASSLSGTDGKEAKAYKGVNCVVSAGSYVGVSANLQDRDALKSGKVKEIEGKIVGISEFPNIIIEPQNLHY